MSHNFSKIGISFFSLVTTFTLSCGGTGNSTVNNSANVLPNSKGAVSTNTSPSAVPGNASNSTSPATLSANTSDPNSLHKATPLGTPANGNLGSGRITKPGATPTPGIPSPEEMKRMMGRMPTNINAPTMQGAPMMKSRRPLGGRVPNSNHP